MDEKNTYHVVLKRSKLRLYGVAQCQFIVLVDNLVVTVGVRQLGYVVLCVGWLKEKSGLLLKPPKVLHPWPAPMSCTVEVVLSSSSVPQSNISRVLSCPICRIPNLPLVYPAHETNHNLMSKRDKFATKHTTHK
jgi:hypothetical protein